jgi:oxalate decarboxylase/phosphoglucose isomerase-like protein (cupin superfamily)
VLTIHARSPAGQSVIVPPGTAHALSNPTDRPARMLTHETPARQLEHQFRVLASTGRMPPLIAPTEINVDHELSFVLTGGPENLQLPVW